MKKKKLISLSLLPILVIAAVLFSCDGTGIPGAPGGPDDASLSNLVLSTGELNPVFSSGTTGYTVALDSSTTSITVTATAVNAEASIKVAGKAVASGAKSEAISLSAGLNTIAIEVTSADGSTLKTYTLNITVNGVKISGRMTVTDPNDTKAGGKKYYIGILPSFESEDIAFTEGTWAEGSTHDFEIDNVPPGTYYLYALVDWNEDGTADEIYPDYGGIHGIAFADLAGMYTGGSIDPPNLTVGSEDMTGIDIADIQQLPSADLTVQLTGTGQEQEMKNFAFGVFTEDNYVPGGEIVSASEIIARSQAQATVTVPLGEGYYIFVMIDMDGSGTDAPDFGDYVGVIENIAVSGELTETITFAEMELYTEAATDGSIAVSLTGGNNEAGETLEFGVFNESDDPMYDDPIASGEFTIDANGEGYGIAYDSVTSDIFTGTDGTTYLIGIHIDMNANNEKDEGDMLGIKSVTIAGATLVNITDADYDEYIGEIR